MSDVVPNVFEEFLEKNMWKLKEPKVEGLLQKREILCEMNFSHLSVVEDMVIMFSRPKI